MCRKKRQWGKIQDIQAMQLLRCSSYQDPHMHTHPSALTSPTTTEAPQPLCMVTNKQQADLPTNPQFC